MLLLLLLSLLLLWVVVFCVVVVVVAALFAVFIRDVRPIKSKEEPDHCVQTMCYIIVCEINTEPWYYCVFMDLPGK